LLIQRSLKLSPQAIVTKLFDASLMPPHCIGQRFPRNPAFLAVREFKMEGSAELVDLAETEDARRKPTKAMERFSTGHPVF